jgi:flagellar hook-length control protein FliK
VTGQDDVGQGDTGQGDTGNGAGDSTKSLGTASPPAATASPHEHSSLLATAPAATTPLDASAQAAAAMPQQLSSVTPPTAAGPISVTPATGAPVPVSGLAVEIAASLRGGNTHFEVRLDPAELGRIDVRIDVDRSGQVTSHLTVEKPETLTMLRQDAPQLQQALNDAGLKTGSGGLQFSLRDQTSSNQNNGNNNNQSGAQAQRLIVSNEESAPALVAGRSYGRMVGSSGGIDIRV